MLGAERLLKDRQGALKEQPGAGEIALGLKCPSSEYLRQKAA
jgi:hypothetical protein